MQRDLWTEIAERSRRRAEQQERLRRLDTDLDWRSWTRHRLSAYWYGLLVMFANVGVLATVLSLLSRPAGIASYGIAITFLVPLGYLEWEVYRFLWPSDDEILEALERKADSARAAKRAGAARADAGSGGGPKASPQKRLARDDRPPET